MKRKGKGAIISRDPRTQPPPRQVGMPPREIGVKRPTRPRPREPRERKRHFRATHLEQGVERGHHPEPEPSPIL